MIFIGVMAIVLMSATVAAAVYISDRDEKPNTKAAAVSHTKTTQNNTQQAAATCNDGNIAGKVLGGVGGGVAGSMIGKGSGKTAATIGGTLGGAYIGGETIPLNNVTCSR